MTNNNKESNNNNNTGGSSNIKISNYNINLKKAIVPISVLILALFLVCMYLNSKRSDDLVVGTAPTMAPFTYLGGDHGNEIMGFDIEFANEIAKDNGKDLKIQFMYFPQLVEGLQKNEIDMVASIFAISEERKNQVDFSEPYYSNEIVAIVRKDQLSEFEGVSTRAELGQKNKKIAAQSSTLTLAFAQEITSDNNLIIASKTWDEAAKSLVGGRVDVMFVNKISARMYLDLYDELMILPIDDMWNLEYGFAVKKGNNRLLKSINNTIQRLQSSGEYEKIVDKYIESYIIQ